MTSTIDPHETLLNFAYSPCPNDTYTFSALATGMVSKKGLKFHVHHLDIETLNTHAFQHTYEITKMSFYAWLHVKKFYRLSLVGNALGYGCGPLLIAKNRSITIKDLSQVRIAIPGVYTTANLLLQLYCPLATHTLCTPYQDIFQSLTDGEAECGVIIHESRFLFEQHGFVALCDLGLWWEQFTGLPLPLGAICFRSDLDPSLDTILESLIHQSLVYGKNNFSTIFPLIQDLATEKNHDVITQHITMFVNEYTYNLGDKGMFAIKKLETLAEEAGIIP